MAQPTISLKKTIVDDPKPRHGEAVLQCVLHLSDRKIRFDISIPGLEGNIMTSHQNKEYLRDLVVRALRPHFGARVDKFE